MTSTNNESCIHYHACIRHKIRANIIGYIPYTIGCETCEYQREKTDLVDVMRYEDVLTYCDRLREYVDKQDRRIFDSPSPFTIPMTIGEVLELPSSVQYHGVE